MTFDPHYSWLGIPKRDQPPSYYRLLGVAEFEDSPEVIQNAADRIVAFLRTKATGPNANECNRLLAEVVRAASCLLDMDEKRQYDATKTNAEKQNQERPVSKPPRADDGVTQESPIGDPPPSTVDQGLDSVEVDLAPPPEPHAGDDQPIESVQPDAIDDDYIEETLIDLDTKKAVRSASSMSKSDDSDFLTVPMSAPSPSQQELMSLVDLDPVDFIEIEEPEASSVWYYKLNGRTVGPVDTEEIVERILFRELDGEIMVARSATGNTWVPLSTRIDFHDALITVMKEEEIGKHEQDEKREQARQAKEKRKQQYRASILTSKDQKEEMFEEPETDSVWYYIKPGVLNDEKIGPVDTQHIIALVLSRELDGEIMVAGSATGNTWVPLSTRVDFHDALITVMQEEEIGKHEQDEKRGRFSASLERTKAGSFEETVDELKGWLWIGGIVLLTLLAWMIWG